MTAENRSGKGGVT